jgi:hypothetical protein
MVRLYLVGRLFWPWLLLLAGAAFVQGYWWLRPIAAVIVLVALPFTGMAVESFAPHHATERVWVEPSTVTNRLGLLIHFEGVGVPPAAHLKYLIPQWRAEGWDVLLYDLAGGFDPERLIQKIYDRASGYDRVRVSAISMGGRLLLDFLDYDATHEQRYTSANLDGVLDDPAFDAHDLSCRARFFSRIASAHRGGPAGDLTEHLLAKALMPLRPPSYYEAPIEEIKQFYRNGYDTRVSFPQARYLIRPPHPLKQYAFRFIILHTVEDDDFIWPGAVSHWGKLFPGVKIWTNRLGHASQREKWRSWLPIYKEAGLELDRLAA